MGGNGGCKVGEVLPIEFLAKFETRIALSVSINFPVSGLLFSLPRSAWSRMEEMKLETIQ